MTVFMKIRLRKKFTIPGMPILPRPFRAEIIRPVLFVLLISLSSSAGAADASPSSRGGSLDWPRVTMESRPWAYWWWMGSAVEKEEITKNLELYAEAGLGGVHIIPIYGVRGYKEKYIDYLSPQWMEMLAYTVAESDRLGMGVDMTTGTGWPFGGPQVEPEQAAKTVKIKKRGERYVVEIKGTGQKVKRAAPGGEGLVMDHYSKEALDSYLERFDEAFSDMDARPRAFYNDSFEVYGADWTNDFFDEFKKRRGYDLRDHLAALYGKGDAESVSRVICDYRETISDLLLSEFTIPWVEWTHSQGGIARNQAHGSPGNLLDLYAVADLPETEAFGPSHFDLPGLEYYRTLPEHSGQPNPLVMKFASSAAHVTGKPLVSSESCTWLGEHFTVSLAQVKPEIDQLFSAGINHVFFHGIAYSPSYEDWPGWLFYAPTNFGPSNTFFRDLPALNAYIACTQAFLQSGEPDNDVLLYWPVHDLWSGVYDEKPWSGFLRRMGDLFGKLVKGELKEFADGVQGAVVELYESRRSKVKLFTVHNANEWLSHTSFGKSAELMRKRGYSFDYVSDRMLAGTRAENGKIMTDGGVYSVVVVPECRYMPLPTMQKLAELADAGAAVVFIRDMPRDVPGLADLEMQRQVLKDICSRLRSSNDRVLIGENLAAMLDSVGVIREPIADLGIGFIRRTHAEGHQYFISNLTKNKLDSWMTLGVQAESAVIFDTLRKKAGVAALRKSKHGRAEVYIQLEPGQSLVLRTFNRKVEGEQWLYLKEAGAPKEITGEWNLEFIDGGPDLPESRTVNELKSWTELGDADARYFSGTARYTIEFDLPDKDSAEEWMLDLGRVRESARITINRKDAGILFCHPFQAQVGKHLRQGANTLEIEVTNLPVNRIIYLDRHFIRWKKFHDINFVNIDYLPFTAALREPFPSGLLGPVRLLPCKVLQVVE
jgi:hypothetical protein